MLYPNDEQLRGKELRLQQHFFVSCSLQDMLRILHAGGRPQHSTRNLRCSSTIRIRRSPSPSSCASCRRATLPWAAAWNVTRHTFAYTNHTLLPEALERWPLEVVRPRACRVICRSSTKSTRISSRKCAFDFSATRRIRRMSLIDENGERYVRMAHLACVGSHAINGVAELHTELAQARRAQGFLRAWPREVQQQDQRRDAAPLDGADQPAARGTDHRAHRRRLDQGPGAARKRSNRWPRTPSFAPAGARSSSTTSAIRGPRLERTGIRIDPDSLFDVLVKRIHEYKRQHLKVLHIVYPVSRHQIEPLPRSFGRAPSSSAARRRPDIISPSS